MQDDKAASQTTVDRANLEKEVAAARQEVELAEQDLDRAEDRLSGLEAQLAALPSDGADEELFYARRDPRQMKLKLEMAGQYGAMPYGLGKAISILTGV